MKRIGSPLHTAEDAQKYLRGIEVRVGDIQARQSSNPAVFLISVRWRPTFNFRTALVNDRRAHATNSGPPTSIAPSAQKSTIRGDNSFEVELFSRRVSCRPNRTADNLL